VSIRVVKYEDLVPCLNAFIDTRTPGSDRKENFTIIGPGVSENPHQFVHIKEPHGFNIGGARQPPKCVNSQHSHETAEVFFVQSGKWRFMLGEKGQDAEVVLNPGDLISVPTHVFRGFENIGDDVGYLFAILGGDDPGGVLWAPYVFDMAREYGLVLLEDGSLIDMAAGEVIPDGRRPMPETSIAEVDALLTLSSEELRACCIMAADEVAEIHGAGQRVRPLIGQDAKLAWPHGFDVTQYDLASGHETDLASFGGRDVIYVHKGRLLVNVDGTAHELAPGDTATIGIGETRNFVNAGDTEAVFLRVQSVMSA
jgi:quercetin dioxygenase-like cupin family protein